MPKGDIYAPEFPQTAVWLNTNRPLSLAELRGQVVLLDFWTYCCINCLHVLPDLAILEEKYKKEPFLVISVHAAKFFNERNIENIEAAIERYEINHPVVVDSPHTIWESYGVSAWPSFVLIDSQGRIRGTTSGEGQRFVLDQVIGQLIEEGRKEKTLKSPLSVAKEREPALYTLSFPGKIEFSPGKKGEQDWLYIADTNHHRILFCHLHSPAQAHIKEIVGTGKPGKSDGSFAEATFCHPQGLSAIGDFLYVCDTDNDLLRRIDLKRKRVETLAREARFNSPWDLEYAEGYLYLAMAGSHQIWSYEIKSGLAEVFAGSGLEGLADGNIAAAQLAQPSGVSYSWGSLFFVDSETSALREIDLAAGEVKTLIGRGLFEFGFSDGPFAEAFLQHPLGISAQGSQVFLADSYNSAIRVADLRTRKLTTLISRQLGQVCLIGGRECETLPLWEPGDVLAKGHYLYIADTNNHLIRLFDLKAASLTDVAVV